MAGGLILLYHRVASPGCDPFGLRVTPVHFRQHLRILRRLGHPLPLDELVRRARRGTLPPRGVAITFDDGSPDLLEHALPALQEQEVPATVFVATPRGRPRDYWWEELASLLLRPGELPGRLRLRSGSGWHTWDLGADACYPATRAARHRRWRAFGEMAPTRRHALFEQLWQTLRHLQPIARQRLMARIRSWAAAEERRASARARPLLRPELLRLAGSGVVRLGAHTHRHPLLATLSPAEQWREIHGSRTRLGASIGVEIDAFAYPFGGRGSYSAQTVQLVRDAGFQSACSTRPGRVQRSADPHRLPRVAVGDWNTDDFARWFTAWTA